MSWTKASLFHIKLTKSKVKIMSNLLIYRILPSIDLAKVFEDVVSA